MARAAPAVWAVLLGGFALAGCTSGPLDGQGTKVDLLAQEDGLVLRGVSDRRQLSPEAVATFTFTAENVGEDAVTWGVCYDAWSFSVRDAEGRRLPLRPVRPSEAQCQGFSKEPLPRGAVRETTATWDGTVYEGEVARRAQPGAYTFMATFSANREGERASVSGGIAVEVLS